MVSGTISGMERKSQPERQPELVIMDACPNDAQAYRALERDVWESTYVNARTGITKDDIDWYFNHFKRTESPEMIEKFTNELGNLDELQKAFVVKERGCVVGSAWLMKNMEFNTLGSIYIHPEFQKRGLGKKIWEEASSFFDPAKPTVVTVNISNDAAVAFYKSLGFQQECEIKPELCFPSGAKFQEIRMIRPPDKN
jgi:ribosomal protein S18 acetylase RimI-like enzyme